MMDERIRVARGYTSKRMQQRSEQEDLNRMWKLLDQDLNPGAVSAVVYTEITQYDLTPI